MYFFLAKCQMSIPFILEYFLKIKIVKKIYRLKNVKHFMMAAKQVLSITIDDGCNFSTYSLSRNLYQLLCFPH